MDIKAISGGMDTGTAQAKKSKVETDSFEQYLQKAYNDGDKEKLKKACDDFEGIFLNMMFKEMRNTVQKSELLPTDTGNDIFQGMLDEELMNNAAKKGRVGLSNMLYKQLSTQMNRAYTPDSVSKAVINEKK